MNPLLVELHDASFSEGDLERLLAATLKMSHMELALEAVKIDALAWVDARAAIGAKPGSLGYVPIRQSTVDLVFEALAHVAKR